MDKVIYEDLKNIYSRDIPWNKLKGSTVLITGAYGMIASYMIYMFIFLNEEKNFGIQVIPVVRSQEKFKKRFGEYADRDYIYLCLFPLTETIQLEGKIDYVIHAASLASPQHYFVRPVDVMLPNVIGTYKLLEMAKEQKIKGFLFFSSGAIYGTVYKGHDIREFDMGEIDPLNIQSCYGEGKRMGETMCKAYETQYGVPIKIARLWHTYAPTMDIENDPRVFASFMKNVIRSQDIEMNSDGGARRAFCYISDAVAGLFLVLIRGKAGEAYNVCNSSQFCDMNEFAQKLAGLRSDVEINVKVGKRNIDEEYVENPAVYAFPPSDKKLRGLGWIPEYDISSGFFRVLEALKDGR